MDKQRLNFSLVGGHVVECFDNTLYGFFAVMLAPLFFPSVSEHAALLASFGAFAAGFMARPLGALYFGFIGDRMGRRQPLLMTMVLVGIPTLVIGFIPSYESIGVAAPIILVSCRLLQGFFWGGEFAGVNLYISESHHVSTRGRKTGLLLASGAMGAVLATLIGAVFSMKIMPDWAWRVPFVLGGLTAIAIYLLRRNLKETHEYASLSQQKKTDANPYRMILANHKGGFIVGMLIAGLTIMPLYSTTILGNQLFKSLGYTTSQSLMLNMSATMFAACMVVVFGRMADVIGFKRQMLVGTIGNALVALPGYWLVSGGDLSLLHIYGFMFLLVGTSCIINGCAMPFISTFFPTACRYTGVAMSVTVGQALLGGTMPLIGSWLTVTFAATAAPAIWLIIISLLTTASILWLKADNFNGFFNQRKNSVAIVT